MSRSRQHLMVAIIVIAVVLSCSGSVTAQQAVTFSLVGECDLHFGNFMLFDEQQAFITDPPVVDKILRHVGWYPGEPAPDLIRAPPATPLAMLKVTESPPKT